MTCRSRPLSAATLVVVAMLLVGCGAGKQRAAAPATSAVVEIAGATPQQLERFDANRSAPPAARSRRPGKSEPPHRQYVRVDEPTSRQWPGRASVGGPDCDLAVLCCTQLVLQQKSGLGPSAVKVCDSFRHRPSASCHQVLELFRRAVKQSGGQCP